MSKWKYSMEMELEFPSAETAKIVYKAVCPELKDRFERSETSFKINKNVLYLNVYSMDKTALKASFNSYFKLIMVANDIKEVI